MINPYRNRKSLMSRCLMMFLLPLIFVGTNIVLLTSWMHLSVPVFDLSERRSLRSVAVHDSTTKNVNNNGDNTNDGNDDNVLHVITTRFMQNQPKLIELGTARLRLFETFCLPTMLNQEADNFLWFVMTDPELDRELLGRLQELLESRPNFYLIASNAKLLTPKNLTSNSPIPSIENNNNNNDHRLSHHDHFSMDSIDDTIIRSTTTTTQKLIILTGDMHLLYSRMFDTNRPLLIETRLDADDGLHKNVLSKIQDISRALPVDTSGWQIICSNIHYEWRNDDITVNPITDSATTVHTSDIRSNNDEARMSSGKIRLVKESICVTPGYTLVRHRKLHSIEFPAWPKLGHNLVAREWPECSMIKNTTRRSSIVINNDSEEKRGNATTNCWIKMGYYPSALRSRTITSAGMSRIDTDQEKNEKEMYENRTRLFWTYLQRDFDVKPNSAIATSQHIKDNLKNIVLDNLKGQW